MGHKPKFQKDGVRILEVVLASFLMAFAMNTFLEEGGLVPGGFTGMSKLIQRICLSILGIDISFSAINLSLNAIPAIYAFRHVGKKFVIYSCLVISLTGFLIDLIPVVPLTHDMLLITVIGGVLYGASIGIALNANASSGGTDFIAMAIADRYNIPVWNYMLVFNAIIILISGWLFSVDAALYSILFQFIATKVINLMHMRYQRKTVYIITKDPQPLADALMKLTHHGVTRFEGLGCYSGESRYLLYMVVSKKDIRTIKHFLRGLEPEVFMNVADSEQLGGYFYLEPME